MDHRSLRRKGFGRCNRLRGTFCPERFSGGVAASILLAFQETDGNQPCVWDELPGYYAFREP